MADIKSMFLGGASWPELNWVVTDSLASATAADEDTGRFSIPDPTDVAFIQYTSGKDKRPHELLGVEMKRTRNAELMHVSMLSNEGRY